MTTLIRREGGGKLGSRVCKHETGKYDMNDMSGVLNSNELVVHNLQIHDRNRVNSCNVALVSRTKARELLSGYVSGKM